jgi:hypothetical protein
MRPKVYERPRLDFLCSTEASWVRGTVGANGATSSVFDFILPLEEWAGLNPDLIPN